MTKSNLSLYMQGIFILGVFIIFIVFPSVDLNGVQELLPNFLINYKSDMFYGIFHINSALFIFSSALILYIFIDKNSKKIVKAYENKKIKEAEKYFEEYFEEKISLLELEDKTNKNKIIKEVLKILRLGGIEDDLLLGVQKIYNKIDNFYTKLKNEYEYAATLMPIIGMIGTVAGLLMMFSEPSQAEDFEKKFAGLSLALATTLYASLVTIVFFKPLARQKERQQIELENDFNDLEIEVRKFYHKVDLTEFLENGENIEQEDIKEEENEEEKI
ncbi:MotA/TolQ/ExbB proton channel family protein [Arcobacter porcinus]|uniref:MotA/TolQ/ExbB proton channel family protein n=1 Tax=Arcobacter porcinus TaxID=1935204 RepID=UPI00082477BC|nr:MotA/TolQ/ExbB proton channel family protein [Arcobacter porcinus]OCL85428.1 flagellar motor protein MotP [Arcobacter porcinus]